MARRATSLNKKRATGRNTPPESGPEAETAIKKRRGRQVKEQDMAMDANGAADAFFPGGEDAAAGAADSAPETPAKAKRGRKPKVQPAAEEMSSPAPEEMASEETTMNDQDAHEASPEPMETASAPASGGPSAARWDAESGTATFDWPRIEQVAGTEGPNQAMAKLLLAARAEGSNSRWPF